MEIKFELKFDANIVFKVKIPENDELDLETSMPVQKYPTKPLHKISAPQAHVFLAGKFFIV